MVAIVDFTSDISIFACKVFEALYKEDRLKTLYDAGLYMNTGWPIDEGYESFIGFEKLEKNTLSGTNIEKTIFSLDSMFGCSLNDKEFKEFLQNKDTWYKQFENQENIYILNKLPHYMCKHSWSETYEHFPDGTLKNPCIQDLEYMVNTYYKQFSIVKKLIDGTYHYGMIIS